MGFVGRRDELMELEGLLGSNGRRACAIYGRRQTGKTSLIEEFCKDKRSVFLMMVPGSERQNLDHIQDAMSTVLGRDVSYETFPQFISDLTDYCRQEPTIVVFDELPFLLDKAPHVAGYLQNFIDIRMKGTETTLIVCGSSISSMEKETSDPSRPLYNRFRLRMHIEPMSFEDVCMFHPTMSDTDKVRMYLTFGGMPAYHEWLTQDTYKDAVMAGYLGRNAYLREETRNMMLKFRNSELCMSILEAVSSGASRLNEIADRAGVQKDTCRRCIEELEHFGILSRMTSMCGSPKHPVYYIRDAAVRFFFDVIDRSRTVRINRDPEAVYSNIKGRIDTFLGRRFEDMCSEYVARNYPCVKIGRCWGTFLNVDSGISEDGDIDIAASVLTDNGRVDLFGECKFTSKRTGFTEFKKLETRVSGLDGDLAVRYIMFSISGFEEDFAEFARMNGILLVGLDEIMGRTPAPSLTMARDA